MAIRLQVLSPLQTSTENIVPYRLVPVRLARAVDGFTDDTAPDLDDHGNLPTSFCQAHGPVVGVMPTKTIRVQVVRDRLEAATNLFVTTDDAAKVAIDFPPAGQAIPAADGFVNSIFRQGNCIFLTGGNVTADDETLVKIRANAADGPVLAELSVRIYPKITINVKAHTVTINGIGPNVTMQRFTDLFADVNKIYAQAGIEFVLDPTLSAEAVNGFANNGSVTLTNIDDSRNTELQTVLRQNSAAGMLNAYAISAYQDITQPAGPNQFRVLGIAFSQDDATNNPAEPARNFPGAQAGITFRDNADQHKLAHTIAHEIGHSLRLQHYNLGNGSNNRPTDQREDIWCHRCLMYNIVVLLPTIGHPGDFRANNFYKSSNERIDIGYGVWDDGRIATGQLLMTKLRDGIEQSDQVSIVRASANAGTCFPV